MHSSLSGRVICIPAELYGAISRLFSSLVIMHNVNSTPIDEGCLRCSGTHVYYDPKLIEIFLKYLMSDDRWCVAVKGITTKGTRKVYRCLNIPDRIEDPLKLEAANQIKAHILGNDVLLDTHRVDLKKSYDYAKLPTPRLLCSVAWLVSISTTYDSRMTRIPEMLTKVLQSKLDVMIMLLSDAHSTSRVRAQVANVNMVPDTKGLCDNYENCNCDQCLLPRCKDKPCSKCGAKLPWEDMVPLGYVRNYDVVCKPCYQRDFDNDLSRVLSRYRRPVS